MEALGLYREQPYQEHDGQQKVIGTFES